MRKMINQYGRIVNVKEHIILQNLWEYYVTDEKYSDDIVNCVVLGFECEEGDVYIPEIVPYIISKSKDLRDLMPAPNWKWIE